jgi:hypothetical protein
MLLLNLQHQIVPSFGGIVLQDNRIAFYKI